MPATNPIGSMRDVVTYQTRTDTPNSYGQPRPGFAGTQTFRALVRSPTGREAMNATQMKATVSHVVEVRWPGFDLDPKGRFLWGAKVLQIAYAVDTDGRRRRLNVHCTELIGQAP